MGSQFDDLFQATAVPALFELFAEKEPLEYRAKGSSDWTEFQAIVEQREDVAVLDVPMGRERERVWTILCDVADIPTPSEGEEIRFASGEVWKIRGRPSQSGGQQFITIVRTETAAVGGGFRGKGGTN